jgi:two-component system, NarL family, sensor histidine kinase DesK
VATDVPVSTRSANVERVDTVSRLLLTGRRRGLDEPDETMFNPVSTLSLDARRGRGRLLAVVWLIYLTSTVQAAWELDNPWRRGAGLVVIALFALLYIRVFYIVRMWRWTGKAPLTPVEQYSTLGVGVALAVAACLLVGQEGTSFAVYLAVMSILMLPMRPAAIAVAAIILGTWIATETVPGWTADDGLVLSTFLAALAVWGITQMIARNRQLALANEEISGLAVSQERLRFSRDLHDILGHSLTVITLKAELAGRLVEADPQRAAREIAEVERLARTALADVRSTAAGYRNLTLAGELASARIALDAAGIEADLAGAVDDVPAGRLELFGWTVREGVTNVVRHSGARHCRVTIERSGIEIWDDGNGPNGCEVGNGLNGLRERAEAAGAALSVRAGDEGGFVLRVGW